MDTERIAAAMEELAQPDVDAKIRAVQDLADTVREIVAAVVAQLQEPYPVKYLIYERVTQFGSLAVSPLRQLLRVASDRATRVAAAAALLNLGANDGVSVALEAVQWGDPDLCLVVRALARARVEAAVPLIQRALDAAEFSTETQPTIECLLSGLRVLGAPVPDSVRERLHGAEPGWLAEAWARELQRM